MGAIGARIAVVLVSYIVYHISRPRMQSSIRSSVSSYPTDHPIPPPCSLPPTTSLSCAQNILRRPHRHCRFRWDCSPSTLPLRDGTLYAMMAFLMYEIGTDVRVDGVWGQ